MTSTLLPALSAEQIITLRKEAVRAAHAAYETETKRYLDTVDTNPLLQAHRALEDALDNLAGCIGRDQALRFNATLA